MLVANVCGRVLQEGTVPCFIAMVSRLSPAGTSSLWANTTTGPDRESLRVADGSGTFQQGAPRELEFSMKLNF